MYSEDERAKIDVLDADPGFLAYLFVDPAKPIDVPEVDYGDAGIWVVSS